MDLNPGMAAAARRVPGTPWAPRTPEPDDALSNDIPLPPRSDGDTRPGDAGELALIAADLEGLTAMEPAAAEPLTAVRSQHAAPTAARARAVEALSAAEDGALGGALYQRLDEIAALLAEALGRDNVRLKRMRIYRSDWTCPPKLLTALQMRNASRPDLATHTGAQPWSTTPSRNLPKA